MIVAAQASTTTDVQETIVDAQIVNATPRLRYGNGKQRWRPENAVVTWVRKRVDGGRWSSWQPVAGEVWGPRLRGDGSRSGHSGITEALELDDDSHLTRLVVEETKPGR